MRIYFLLKNIFLILFINAYLHIMIRLIQNSSQYWKAYLHEINSQITRHSETRSQQIKSFSQTTLSHRQAIQHWQHTTISCRRPRPEVNFVTRMSNTKRYYQPNSYLNKVSVTGLDEFNGGSMKPRLEKPGLSNRGSCKTLFTSNARPRCAPLLIDWTDGTRHLFKAAKN